MARIKWTMSRLKHATWCSVRMWTWRSLLGSAMISLGLISGKTSRSAVSTRRMASTPGATRTCTGLRSSGRRSRRIRYRISSAAQTLTASSRTRSYRLSASRLLGSGRTCCLGVSARTRTSAGRATAARRSSAWAGRRMRVAASMRIVTTVCTAVWRRPGPLTPPAQNRRLFTRSVSRISNAKTTSSAGIPARSLERRILQKCAWICIVRILGRPLDGNRQIHPLQEILLRMDSIASPASPTPSVPMKPDVLLLRRWDSTTK